MTVKEGLESDRELHGPWWATAVFEWVSYSSRLLLHCQLSHRRINVVGPLVRTAEWHREEHERRDEDPWDLAQEAELGRRALQEQKSRGTAAT